MDNEEYIENAEQYLKELEMMNTALAKIKDQIVTWHGKQCYKQCKHTIEALLELNNGEEKGAWIPNT